MCGGIDGGLIRSPRSVGGRATGSPLIIRSDLLPAELRHLARRERDGRGVAWVDQKGHGVPAWFERGIRPAGSIDHRYAFAWRHAAVRPGADKAFALMPEVSTQAM